MSSEQPPQPLVLEMNSYHLGPVQVEDLTRTEEGQQVLENDVHHSARNFKRGPSREVCATHNHVGLHATLSQQGPTRFLTSLLINRLGVRVQYAEGHQYI